MEIKVNQYMDGDVGVMMRGEETIFISESLNERIACEGLTAINVMVIPQVNWCAPMQPQLYGDFEETEIKFRCSH